MVNTASPHSQSTLHVAIRGLPTLITLLISCAENIPVRNSDVDYRLLEAAKAGDLDTVKVTNALAQTGKEMKGKKKRLFFTRGL